MNKLQVARGDTDHVLEMIAGADGLNELMGRGGRGVGGFHSSPNKHGLHGWQLEHLTTPKIPLPLNTTKP